MDYAWLSSVPQWANVAILWHQRATAQYKALWTTAGLSMFGGLIFFSAEPPASLAKLVAYGAAGLGIIQMVVTMLFVARYSAELNRLYALRPTVLSNGTPVPDQEVRAFLKRGPSVGKIMMSSMFVGISLCLPALNIRFLGRPAP
jgi:hypothetical protein